LGRKQIIQQQREKKQELLKQLDTGMANRTGLNQTSVSGGEQVQVPIASTGLCVEGVGSAQVPGGKRINNVMMANNGSIQI